MNPPIRAGDIPRQACADFVDFGGLNATEQHEYAELLVPDLLAEAHGHIPPWEGHAAFNIGVSDATKAVESAPISRGARKVALNQIDLIVERAGSNVVAGDVLAVRGCANCVNSSGCAIKTALEERKTASNAGLKSIDEIAQDHERLSEAHVLANAFSKYMSAKSQVSMGGVRREKASSIRSRMLDTILAITAPEDRDTIMQDTFKLLPGNHKVDFPNFANGVAAEVFVLDQLGKAEERFGWKIRMPSSKEDVVEGTDIILEISNESAVAQEVRIDTKTRGSYVNLLASGKMRELDPERGHFGLKMVNGQPVLVINPEGSDPKHAYCQEAQLDKRRGIKAVSFRPNRNGIDAFAQNVQDIITTNPLLLRNQ